MWQAIIDWLKNIFKVSSQSQNAPIIQLPIKPKPAPLPEPEPIPGPIYGIDAYHGDAIIDWGRIAQTKKYAFLKASEGLSVKDSTYVGRRDAALKAGLIVGSYHYFHPAGGAVAQAKNYLSVIGKLGPNELPPVIDFETHEGLKAPLQIQDALSFLNAVEFATGRTPIIYASPSFIDELGNPAQFAPYHLWIANYGVSKPRIPKPWSDYTFWQNSEGGNVDGIQGHVDLDIFNGNLSQLMALTKS